MTESIIYTPSFHRARYLAFEVIKTICPGAARRFDSRFSGLWAYYRDEDLESKPAVRDVFAEQQSASPKPGEGLPSEKFIYLIIDALFHDFLKLHRPLNHLEFKDRFCEEKLGDFLKRYFPELDRRSSEFKRLKRICRELQAESRESDHPLIGASKTPGKRTIFLESANPVFRESFSLAAQAARSKAPILLIGESGTGKEILARFIHEQSPRADRPFVAVNCAAIPDELFESELFGHFKGAFTGAHKDKPGQAVLADGGTLFLDEIALISPHTQAKLLRFLQEEAFIALGGVKEKKVDVRIVAATNADLNRMMKEARFRQDLYYRLNVFRLSLPPLRDRLEDIEPLSLNFIGRYNRQNQTTVTALSPAARQCLAAYAWPGNVRELENAIQRAVILTRNGPIPPENLPPEVLLTEKAPFYGATPLRIDVDALEKAMVNALNLAPDRNSRHGRIGLSIPPSRLLDFFITIGPHPFPPREFTDFITPPGRNAPRNKLAAHVLKALREAGIIDHNGGRAQAVRYQLSHEFFLFPE